ncbi:hypothetical protein MTR_1056s0010 [Medicago truncatula]|uniref:Retrotransposon gag domain-containing protein n=1 Tax=Medicago truncatula TaxID=3880 RepID=A0A072TD24_MEDTR|nr:hypothetical protein MTR_1056s0010 [Medicago truncatula]
MAGRNDAALAAALEAVAQAVQQQPSVVAGNDGVRMLETFLRNHPPTFKGRYDPDGALKWLKEVETIFRVMQCSEVQKVRFGTHMMAEEANDWWQGDMSVTEYAAKFVELSKFYPHYTAETTQFFNCIKFENGLRADIKRAIGYQKIRNFSELVSSCRIYEEDTKAHYKVMSERREGHISSQCKKPKKFRTGGKVFALTGTQTVNEDRLIKVGSGYV